MLDTISVFLNLLRIDLWCKMWSILENVPCALEKKLYSSAFGWNVLKISVRSSSSNVSFKTFVSLLCLDDLSISVIGVLKSPAIFALLSISPFMSVSVCLTYWGAHSYVGCTDIYDCYVFLLDWSLDHYVVSFLIACNLLYFNVYFDTRIATPAFFCFPFAWNIFFHPLTFSLYVSWGLKWVSCRQHIYGSHFCIHSTSLCLCLHFNYHLCIKEYFFTCCQ